MKRLLACTLAAVALVGAGCDNEAPAPPPSAAEPTPEPDQPARRPPTGRPRLRVENEAFGSSRGLVGRAVADLKRLGFWDDLTGHLYVVRFASRPGPANVPLDRHLADAVLTAEFDRRGSGPVCDVLVFPAALRQDLARIRVYVAQGFLPGPAPTARQFWASIVGHELAHCLGEGKGEATAMRWEKKVMEAALVRL